MRGTNLETSQLLLLSTVLSLPVAILAVKRDELKGFKFAFFDPQKGHRSVTACIIGISRIVTPISHPMAFLRNIFFCCSLNASFSSSSLLGYSSSLHCSFHLTPVLSLSSLLACISTVHIRIFNDCFASFLSFNLSVLLCLVFLFF